MMKLTEPKAAKREKMKPVTKASRQWTTVKVSAQVAAKARSLRKRLLKAGQSSLPPDLRGSILIPEDLSPKLIDKKFGLGHIFQLSLEALDRGLKDGAAR